MTELVTGPTSNGVPWPKVVLALVVTGVLILVFGVGGTQAIEEDRHARFDEYRLRCAELPEAVEAAVASGLVDLDDRSVRGVGTSQSEIGPQAGSWFVSIELASPGLPRGSVGDIATFLVPDAGGAPAATDIQAVGDDAARFSSWPLADDVFVDEDGGIASRWCAGDDGPAVLYN